MAKKQTNKKKKASEEIEHKGIEIPSLELSKARITLIGESPLLVNRFDEKSKQQIEDKRQKKAKNAKTSVDPKERFMASLYKIPGKTGVYGVPASGVKKCAVSACRYVDGVPMTVAKGSFHVLAGGANLVPIKGSKPVMDEQTVRIGSFGSKVPDTRYRARFDKWSLEFDVVYNSRVISPDQILNLYQNAGFSVGLCEWRPEKDGNYGMFSVKKA